MVPDTGKGEGCCREKALTRKGRCCLGTAAGALGRGQGEGGLLGIVWILVPWGRGPGIESPQEKNIKESQRQIYSALWWTLQ